MRLVINIDEDNKNSIESVEGKASIDSLIAMFLSLLEYTVEYAIADGSEGTAMDLYESMDYLFYKFMEKCFPDIQPREFDINDAALIFAQDQIIDKAAKEGKTFDEALKEYEMEAKAYVKARMGAVS
jgi:hypothetical protein